MATEIHPTAIVAEGAEIGQDVIVGPYSIIGEKVKIGDGSVIKSHASIDGRTELGAECKVYPFAAVGHAPQDLKYNGEDTSLQIGDRTVIRESATVQRGSVGGDGVTRVGSDCYLMAYSHIGHDCVVGNNVTLANSATLSGHVQIEDRVVISGFVGVHQYCRVGTLAMIAGFARLTKDVPPYVMVAGVDSVKVFGLNSVGLKRGGISEEAIKDLKAAYKILFKKGSLKDAMKKVQEELPYTDEIQHLIEFMNQGNRGCYR